MERQPKRITNITRFERAIREHEYRTGARRRPEGKLSQVWLDSIQPKILKAQ
jgi:hypothetical protein